MAGYATTLIRSIWEALDSASMFPYDDGKTHRRSPTKPHMKDVAFQRNPITKVTPDIWYFEIGNENAQAVAPQYAIFSNAKIIRRPYRGTDKTRGSQSSIKDKGKRDYNVHSWRERTQTKGELFGAFENIQEYRQNQSRNFWGNADKAREYSERVKYHHTYNRNYLENKHWMYIERILGVAVPFIADTMNAQLEVFNGADLGIFNTYQGTDNPYQPNYTFVKQDRSFFTADYDNAPNYEW